MKIIFKDRLERQKLYALKTKKKFKEDQVKERKEIQAKREQEKTEVKKLVQ
jgi:hypothetical protein